jgi:hypothetical protein
MNTPPQGGPSAAGRAAAGGGLGCLVGALLLPIVVFIGVLIANALDPVCGTPADSGGCEMGLVSSTATAIVPGALVGIVVGALLGLRRSRQEPGS